MVCGRQIQSLIISLCSAVMLSAPIPAAVAQGAPEGFADMGQASPDYAQVRPDRVLIFPDDHQAHDKFRLEWWYVTANLTTENGEPLGLQWTLFRNALTPPIPDKAQAQNPWANETIW
ncbi:MAG: lipocalin-like domain-containing protein, partial [Pseudomonadota bacterium]